MAWQSFDVTEKVTRAEALLKSALGPDCVKTQATDVILRDKFSLFYNSRSIYFEHADFVDTDSIL
ncbi:MAG: hypothetical protein ACI9UO_002397 [Nitrospinales bacterium]